MPKKSIYILVSLLSIGSPFIVGAFPDFILTNMIFISFATGVGILIVMLIFLKKLNGIYTGMLFLSVFSLSITAGDLLLRYFSDTIIFFRPTEVFIRFWHKQPILKRFVKNVRYKGVAHGELSFPPEFSDSRQERVVIFETDEFGFRNDPDAHSNEVDLIVLGDSFGLGSGTSQENIIGEYFKEKYDRTVYNLSMVGSPWSSLINLKMMWNNLKIKQGAVILWLQFSGNDLEETYYDNTNVKYIPKFSTRLHIWFYYFRERSPLHILLKRLRSRDKKIPIDNFIFCKELDNGRNLLFYREYIDKKYRTYREIISHKNYDKLKNVFTAMASFIEDKDVSVKVVLIPSKAEVYEWLVNGMHVLDKDFKPSGYSKAINELCSIHNFAFLDLQPYLLQESVKLYTRYGELLWWHDDTHWNNHGHEKAADIIYSHMLK
ncbi:MAG: hypothetical protein GF384_00815 [Elusimicrobia bacterium]|nr:hypothetical protein [Elusimicrobiota bacterium]